ncbi:MAG: hypothetical protein FWH43_05310 [Endomicrobia bacterium]|nr:hypothetical protein [Endomicrobiia bacterium]
MDIDNPQTYKQLLARLALINIFFVIFMTFTSFLIFISYDTVLWHNCQKSDIFKVFFQAARFNLSIAGYFNMPVFFILAIFLTLRPSHIIKPLAGFIKSYYLSAFVASVSLLTLSFLVKNMPGIEDMMSSEYLSNLSIIYSGFDNPTFITMTIVMSILFLIIVIFFILFFKMVLNSKEYAVDDYQQAIVATVIALILCICFAKGKVIGSLTVNDSALTPVMQLNDYAIAGPYKIFRDIKAFNTSNIIVAKDKKSLFEQGFVITDDNDEEKAKELLFRFNPRE